MDNLFLDAMTFEQYSAYEDTKKNKVFALKLVGDLSKIFQTNHTVEDSTHYSKIELHQSVRCKELRPFCFFADKNGVIFRAKVLGYRTVNPGSTIMSLEPLYEKYKTTSAADKNFLSEHKHGYVNFSLPITHGDHVVLRDIITLMEFVRFIKIF